MADFKLPEGAIELDPIQIPSSSGPPMPQGAVPLDEDPTAGAAPTDDGFGVGKYLRGAGSETAQGVGRVVGGLMQQWRGMGNLDMGQIGSGTMEAIGGASQVRNAMLTPIQEQIGKLVSQWTGSETAGKVADFATGIVGAGGMAKGEIKALEAVKRRIPSTKPMQTVLKEGVDEISDTLPVGDWSLRRAGAQVKRDYASKMKEVKGQVDNMYAQARSVVPDTHLETPQPLFDAADSLMKSVQARQGVLPTKAQGVGKKVAASQGQAGTPPPNLASFSNSAQQQIMASLQNRQNQWSYSGLEGLHKQISSERSKAIRAGDDDLAHQYKTLLDGVDQSIQIFEGKFPALKTLRDQARNFYADAYAPYFKDGAFAREVANKNPEVVVQSIIKKNNYTQIQNVKDMLGKGGTWQKVSKAWWDDVVRESTEGGEFNPNKLVNTIRGYKPEVLTAVLGPKVAGKGGPLRELLDTVEKIEKQTPGIFNPRMGPAGMGFGVVRIIGATLAGRPMEAMTRAGSLLVTPVVMAKLLSDEKGLKLLNEGFKVTPGTKRAAMISAELGALIRTTERTLGREQSEQVP